jgi:hypothetical protein
MIDVCQSLSLIAYQCEHDVNKANLELTRAWGLAAEASNAGDAPYFTMSLLKIFETAKTFFQKDQEEHWTWNRRCLDELGKIIDRGQDSLEVAYEFVFSSINLVVFRSEINGYSTSDRLLLCLAVMEKDSASKKQTAFTQWIAGYVLSQTAKSREDARKSIRLIKTALRAIKAEDSLLANYVYFLGSGVIAKYHFQREEYDLAADWYREILKDAMNKDAIYYKETSAKLEECLKRMKG